MTDTATPETGPVDAPASLDNIVAEFETGNEAPADALESVTQELVNEAEGAGDAEQAPATEDDATPADDEAKEPKEDSPADDEPKYTVKVNGEDHEVPLSELQKGYSRTEDYKAKTMALADERRTLETERSQVETRVAADYASKLEQATNLFAQFDPVLVEARQLNWDALKATDPAAYVQAQDAVNARLQTVQQMNAEVARLNGETQQRQQAQTETERAERFDRAANKIVETMPELADEVKFKGFATNAIDFLRSEGITQPEIADMLDERVLRIADKARRWDAHLQAQKSLPAKKVVQRSAASPLKTDGTSSRATPPQFPARASREGKADWIAQQILSEE